VIAVFKRVGSGRCQTWSRRHCCSHSSLALSLSMP